MLVYVLNKYGKPLMPCKPSKARRLLKSGKAVVVKKEPFTIKLVYGSSGYKQDVSLGVDTGSKFVGVSATTKNVELFSAVVELRSDITRLLSDRKAFRNSRRRRIRHRKCRFNNRRRKIFISWIPPSIDNKIKGHLKIISMLKGILPIKEIIVEIGNFDMSKITNSIVDGNFWNKREYILSRDKHTCKICGGKSGDHILNVHHIKSRRFGGDSPDNLVTLCKTCHSKIHSGELQHTFNIISNRRDTSHMNIIGKFLFTKLKNIYKNVYKTYGYITKSNRIDLGLVKEHYNDAFCIAGNLNAKRILKHFYFKQVRKHNRKIHKGNILKGNKKRLNQAQYIVKGFRLFDKILYKNIKCFVYGRRQRGYFILRTLDYTKIGENCKYTDMKLLSKRSSFLVELRNSNLVSNYVL